MGYLEPLPSSCPTPTAVDVQLVDVWRFLRGTVVANDSFCSHAALGHDNRRGVPECIWASCSLFVGDAKTKSMLKLPKFKNFQARAELRIPVGSGKSLRTGDHVDFWAYDTFSFAKAIVRVVPK